MKINTVKFVILTLIFFSFSFISENGYALNKSDILSKLTKIENQSESFSGSLSKLALFKKSLEVSNRVENFDGKFLTKINKINSQVVVTIIMQEWKNGAWVDAFRDITTFDESFTNIYSNVFQEWKNNAWENQSRMLFQMNASGQAIEIDYDNWENGSWVPFMKNLMTFDSNGNETQMIIMADSDEDGSLENVSKYDKKYDGNGFLIEEKGSMWEGSAWTEFSKTTYTNDANGNPTEEIFEYHIGGGQYMQQSRSTYTYDTRGNLLTETDYVLDFMTQAWTESSKTIYTYEGLDRVSEILEQNWSGTAWVNEFKTTVKYDLNGNEVETLHQIWDGAAWVNQQRNSSSYDAHSQLGEMIIQEWQAGTWVNTERWIYTYASGSLVKNEKLLIPNAFALKNYPNPFNPATTITFTLPSEYVVSLDIYDTNGQLIKSLVNQDMLSRGEHLFVWDGTNIRNQRVASGVYYYQLKGQNFSKTAPCLLIK